MTRRPAASPKRAATPRARRPRSPETDDGQAPSTRQAPQGGPQHPQDHADDGADRHRAVQEGAGPRHRGRGVHPQDRRAGRRPERERRRRHASAARAAASRSRTVAAAGPHVATAGCAAATTATSSARRSAAIRELQAEGIAVRPGGRPASAGSTSSGSSGIPADADVHAVRGQAAVRRGRDARRPVHRRCTSPGRSTGSTWRTRSSSTPPGRRRSSRRCCR